MKNYKNLINELNSRRDLCLTNEEADNIFSGLIRLNNGNGVDLRIVFPVAFPLKLPMFYIKTDGLKFLHTDSDGKMCLFEESSILLNQNDEIGILTECFDKALEILNTSSNSAKYQKEIKREFDAYWLSISKMQVYSSIETEKIAYSNGYVSWVGNRYVITESECDGKYILYNYFKVNKQDNFFSRKCLIIRLRNSSPLPKIREISWKDVRNYILSNISSSHKRRFKKYLSREIKRELKWIILVLPSNDGDIIFGYRIFVNNKKYIQFKNCINAEVVPLYISRIDREYLLKRAGANDGIRGKSVLLLGCGSLGGFIAENLCAAGIENLDLLDYDEFRIENVHRHLLGIDVALDKPLRNKADVLKEKLEGKYLYTDIDSMGFQDRSVEAFIANTQRLGQYDLIVSALGEPTLNLEINKILFNNNLKIPFVVCFNEPYGIGGHAILNNVNKKSCLRCLYTDIISSDLVEFRGSFVESGQSFKKNISGCGSAFVPYSRLDSQQTAIIATRLILETLRGSIKENTVKSWVGEVDRIKEAGKKESNYYTKLMQGSIITDKISCNPYCPICGVSEK